MEYKTKKNDDATVTITIKTTAQEVENAIQGAYQRARKSVKMPGFRSGKVPMEIVEKQLGDSVYDDAARHLVSETFQGIFDKLEPPPINAPQFQIESFEKGKGAVFIGKYETFPDVKLGRYKKIKVTEDVTDIPATVVDEELQAMRNKNATIKTREAGEESGSDDIFTIELSINKDESTVYYSKEIQVSAKDDEPFPGLLESLRGAHSGEKREFETNLPDDFPDETVAGRKLKAAYTVTQIQYPEYPELNDDFAKEMGEYENLEALRKTIASEVEKHVKRVLSRRTRNRLLENIIENSEFVIPESLVEREIVRRVGMVQSRMGLKNMSLDEFAAKVGQDAVKLRKDFREVSLKNIKEELVILEVAKKEKIVADEREILEDVRNRFGGMMKDEELKGWIEKNNLYDNIRTAVEGEKTLTWLVEHAELKSGEIIEFEKLKASDDFYT